MSWLIYFSYDIRKIFYLLIPIFTGVVIEILQHTTNTGRTFDLWDIVANTIGAFLAFLLIRKQMQSTIHL